MATMTGHHAPNAGEPRVQTLIVEDEPTVATSLKALLAMEGHEVTIAGDVQVARRLLWSRPFDLLVLDLLLPDGDGMELLRELKHDPDLARLAVIVVTATRPEEAAREALSLGAIEYLEKPFNPMQLVTAVRQALAPAAPDSPATR